ncbi:hypothetical protein BGW38_003338 [Lunasporangiospora selenospora]|uniref:RING-type domain-containing protein n=1 Tax=Lunasporangiospora selenospora TaxID=979761 RepID=A0A9P6G1C6_9FUNG|nr:hypothetical protein BGW38_003338 [Lunasporangiospora selenospora]
MTFRNASLLIFINWLCLVVWLISTFESTDATIVVVATNDTYLDRSSAFGPRISDEGQLLSLIAVENLDSQDRATGCERTSTSPPANVPWVALVERGGKCSFVEKVRNMQASGASAVIVGDNQKGPLITMYAREDTSDVMIPSVFVSQTHYRELRYFGMELGKGFLVRMTPDETDWPVLDVIIFIIISPAIVVLFLFFLWKIRMRQQRLADLAPEDVVKNLPIKIFFKSKVQENDPLECVICLEDYEDEEELRVLPCRHVYHVACIDSWLTTRKKFCPICKRDICTPTENTPLLDSSRPRPEYNSTREQQQSVDIPGSSNSPTTTGTVSSSSFVTATASSSPSGSNHSGPGSATATANGSGSGTKTRSGAESSQQKGDASRQDVTIDVQDSSEGL